MRTRCRDPDCSAGEICILGTNPGLPAAGYCVVECDPFTAFCATGQACTSFELITGDGSALTCSNQFGAGGEGTSCTLDTHCAAGLLCLGTSGKSCRPFCDAQHPCSTGTCTPIKGEYFSACVP